jgi:AraC-like DNA-binding protein
VTGAVAASAVATGAPRLVAAGQDRDGARFAGALEAHGAWILLCVGAGNARLAAAGGARHVLRSSSVTLVRPGARLAMDPIGRRWSCRWAAFALGPAGEPLPVLLRGDAPRVTTARLRDPAQWERAWAAAGRCVADAPPADDPLRHGLALAAVQEIVFLLLVNQAAAAPAAASRRPPVDPRVAHVLELLADPAYADASVDTLARAVFLSPSRLSHLVTQELGRPITQIRLALRLHRAAAALRASDERVSAIAAAHGFASPYYFSRQFRRSFGVSPSAYRSGSGSLSGPEAPGAAAPGPHRAG